MVRINKDQVVRAMTNPETETAYKKRWGNHEMVVLEGGGKEKKGILFQLTYKKVNFNELIKEVEHQALDKSTAEKLFSLSKDPKTKLSTKATSFLKELNKDLCRPNFESARAKTLLKQGFYEDAFEQTGIIQQDIYASKSSIKKLYEGIIEGATETGNTALALKAKEKYADYLVTINEPVNANTYYTVLTRQYVRLYDQALADKDSDNASFYASKLKANKNLTGDMVCGELLDIAQERGDTDKMIVYKNLGDNREVASLDKKLEALSVWKEPHKTS